MKESEQLQAAEEPLRQFEAEFPGRRRRRKAMGVIGVFVVLVLVGWTVLFVGMNDRIHQLHHTTATESAQIKHLQTSLNSLNASVSAAVACLQTVGSLEGLCTKLVK